MSDIGDYTTVIEVQVYFSTDGSTLDADSKAALDNLAASTPAVTGT